jgi:hypothetical protein
MPQMPEPPKNSLNQSSTFTLLSAMYSKMTDPLVKIQENINRKKQEFIDITDKLAAIYGEKEKDVKDKLSDTFKRLILKIFNMTAEIDASMEQQSHQKEKKLKDRENKKQNHHEEEEEKKGLSLKQIIDYKLLEIKGEILNLSRRIKAGIIERHQTFKTAAYNEFKKIKEKIVGTLNRIDVLLEPKKEISRKLK